jgi:CHAT domain-containing protein
VLAHSRDGELPFALREGAAVGAVLKAPVYAETEARRSVLETVGRRASVVHIAAHGRFRADAPLFSYLQLADGPLTTADVFGLDLRATLVTLSGV